MASEIESSNEALRHAVLGSVASPDQLQSLTNLADSLLARTPAYITHKWAYSPEDGIGEVCLSSVESYNPDYPYATSVVRVASGSTNDDICFTLAYNHKGMLTPVQKYFGSVNELAMGLLAEEVIDKLFIENNFGADDPETIIFQELMHFAHMLQGLPETPRGGVEIFGAVQTVATKCDLFPICERVDAEKLDNGTAINLFSTDFADMFPPGFRPEEFIRYQVAVSVPDASAADSLLIYYDGNAEYHADVPSSGEHAESPEFDVETLMAADEILRKTNFYEPPADRVRDMSYALLALFDRQFCR